MEVRWKDVIINDIDRYYRLAFYYVKNEHDAKDIIQESLYKALKNEKQLNNEDAVRTWFYKIIVNTALDVIKNRKKIIFIDDNNMGLLLNDDDLDSMELKDAVESLPFKYKTVILLRYFEDMKISDISYVLDENINTIKSRIYTALKKLKIELEEDTFYYEDDKGLG